MTALIAGEVNMMFNGLSPALPHIKSEKLRALAVGGDKRSPLVPDLPTVSESGFQFNTSGWYGVLAPRNTPQPVVARLHSSLVRALNIPHVKARLTEIAVEVNASTPAEFASRLREEMATWSKVITAAGLKGMQVN
jgi:tripartite-type tricarboxylate transporter receptor subunit TctC